MAFKMKGWTGNHGSAFKRMNPKKPHEATIDDIKKGKFGRDWDAAKTHDPYTDLAVPYDPTGKWRKKSGKYTTKLEYGTVKDKEGKATSGEFVRQFKHGSSEGSQRSRKNRTTGAILGKPIMKEWGAKNPVYYDTHRNVYDAKTRDKDDASWEGYNVDNLGTLPQEGFTDSQVSRIEGGYKNKARVQGRNIKARGAGKSFREIITGGIGKRATGRRKAKGIVRRHLDYPEGGGGKDYKESYLEGKNITKTTRRKKGSLNIQRDKVKIKGKGPDSKFVRKTGEGFLGLQNRKKYIDGHLVVKGKHKGSTNLPGHGTNGKTVKKENLEYDGIKVDMPEVKVTPKKVDKKTIRLAKRSKRKEDRKARRKEFKESMARLNRTSMDYSNKNYGI